MSSMPPSDGETRLQESAVARYLRQHPDFFERQPQLLVRLRLRHSHNGSTVSLIERQVEVLRQRCETEQRKLAELVTVARSNNVLAERIHRFTLLLLRAARTSPDRARLLGQIEAGLREQFDGVQAVLVMPAAEEAAGAVEPARFLRSVGAEEPSYRSFGTLFEGSKPRCGQVRDSQREFLFGPEAAGIGSVALIPLGGEPPLGLLALGSPDRDRFHPGMSTEFLARMGELLTETLHA